MPHLFKEIIRGGVLAAVSECALASMFMSACECAHFIFMSEQACCAPRQLCELINKPTEGERWPCGTLPSSLSAEHSHYQPLTLPNSPPAPGVAASPLPPGQLKHRVPTLGPFSGDRGLKEPRRDPPSPAPQPSAGGPPPLKFRRHSDTDKPKGKRPCKTKHTSLKEREKRKEATLSSPGQCCAAEQGAAEDDKVSADTSVWPQYGHLDVCCRGVCFSMPAGASDYAAARAREGGREGGRKYVYNV